MVAERWMDIENASRSSFLAKGKMCRMSSEGMFIAAVSPFDGLAFGLNPYFAVFLPLNGS